LTDRRTFLVSLALGALASPGVAVAAKTAYRIGVLIPGALSADLTGPEPRNPTVKGFLGAMRERGYSYGEDFVIDARGGEGKPESFSRIGRELIDLKPDVIVAEGGMLRGLRQPANSVPVVMAATADAVEDGFAQSLARPGGNFTGMSLQLTETTPKRLELLRDLVPGNAPLAVMWEAPSGRQLWNVVETAARARGWRLQALDVSAPEDIERAFRTARDARAGAMLVNPGGGVFDRHAALITQLAIQHRLPAMYPLSRYVVDFGGLVSYSPNLVAVWQRAAYFVDKILKGAKPADLPIEQPTEFELLINLTAAKAIGLAIPQPFLLRATTVIEPPPPDGVSKTRS
jgi:putative ABC transport system substrate-binding protein